MTLDAQDWIVTLPDGNTTQPISGSLTVDSRWSPYCQGTIVIAREALADFNSIEPRTIGGVAPSRLKIAVLQRYSHMDGVLFSDISTRWAGKNFSDISTYLAGADFSNWSADLFGSGWHNSAGERPWVRRTFDLAIVDRSGPDDATVTLTVESDETFGDQVSPVSLLGVLQTALPSGLFPLHLRDALKAYGYPAIAPSPTSFDYDLTAAAATVLPPGANTTTVTDDTNTYLLLAGASLWCDETRTWHLEAAPLPTLDTINLGVRNIRWSDDLVRASDWYDAVTIVYTWTDAAGVTHTHTDTAGSTTVSFTIPNRTMLVEKQGPNPPDGAAANLLARVQGYGRTVTLTLPNDFALTPRQIATFDFTDVIGDLTGIVSAITWDISTAQMSVTLTNVE